MQIDLSTLQYAAGLLLGQFIITLLSYQLRRFELCIASSAVLVAFTSGLFLAPIVTPIAPPAAMHESSLFIGIVLGLAWLAVAFAAYRRKRNPQE